MAAGGQQLAKKAAENVSAPEEVVESDASNGKLYERRGETANGERVLCFCGNDREFGEMACCELCSGWFHFRCMRFKEKVDLLGKRDFVCCFCLVSKTLVLLREVETLKEEVRELRGVIKISGSSSGCQRSGNVPGLTASSLSLSNERSHEDAGEANTKKLACPDSGNSYSAVLRRVQLEVHSSAKKSKEMSKNRKKPSSQASTPKRRERQMKSREFVGRRKLWGTKRDDLAEKVREFIVKSVPGAASVEVKRVFKSEDGRVRWWFWLEGEESVLKLLDGVDFGEFWRIEKRSPFLESVVVRVLGQR